MKDLPLELFLNDEVQKLLDDFAALLDVRVTFFSPNGEYLRRGKAMMNCDYCRIIQTALSGWEKCVSMDHDKRAEAIREKQIIHYRCHAGLCECLAPVWIRGNAAGFVMFGQFRIAGDKMPDFSEYPVEVREDLTNAYDRLPLFSEEKLQAVLGLLRTLIDYIAVRELAVLQGDHLRAEIDDYITRHANEPIHLPEMAKKIGRSVSTISQFLRRNYQTTFKQLLLDARLKIADELWNRNPDASVAEVAYAAGFRDQFYFSRVFRASRGMPPGKFRNIIRKSTSPDLSGLIAVCKRSSAGDDGKTETSGTAQK